MNEDAFARASDASEQLVAMVAGFKANMIEAGFSERIAEAGALEYLKMLMAATSRGGIT